MKDSILFLTLYFYAFLGMVVGMGAEPEIRSEDMDFTYILMIIGFALLSAGFVRLASKLMEDAE